MANNTKKTKVKVNRKPEIKFSNVTQNFKRKKKNSAVVKDVTKNESKSKNRGHKKHIVLIVLMIFMVLGAILCLAFGAYVIIKAPPFDENKLYRVGSSSVYDANGELIAELGREKRENVSFDELPEILIDAIVATEDSKFFQHSGVDLLRFGKAALGQLLGQPGAGGGSTLTMQITKNSYTSNVDSGFEGIVRKFTDIYMAVFNIEKSYSKQQIFEFYVNQAFLGSNANGVAQAAKTFFGKSVGELNLAEAATIAGLFQAPGAYDPYIYPEKAQARRNIVLGLMVKHGYITQDEADVAKAIPLKDMLSGYNYSYSEYQGFLDTLYYDVYEKTGVYPTQVSMKIYTTLRPDKQKVINQLYDGTLYKWKNDIVQSGIAVTDVETGAVVAVGAGRNKKGELTWNYATQTRRHPGSTAKPIFDYGPAIEYAGWGTGTFVMDDVYSYSNGQSINNVDLGYSGMMMAKTALAKSRNIPALQAFQATTQQQKYEFVTNLGITPELHDKEILESSAIGAFDGVTPMELSAAYATFSRGGYYIEPYTFTKIEFIDTGTTYVHTPTRTKAMSEETAYMINYILKWAVTSGSIGVGGGVSGTDIASKTGTSSEDANTIRNLGLSSSAIKDSWQVIYSPTYSIAFWYGYDYNTKAHYLTTGEGWNARRAIARALTPRIMEKNARWTKPSGVTTVDIELETNPTQLASEFTPDNLRSTEVFKKGTEPTEVSQRFTRLSNVSNLSYTTIGNQIQLSWHAINTPWAIDEGSLQSYFNENFTRWADKYYQRRLTYNQNYIGTVVYEVFLKGADGTLTSLGTTSNTSFNTSIVNATSATFVVKSTYTIFKANASTGSEITVKIDPSFTPSTPDEGDDDQTGDDNGGEN